MKPLLFPSLLAVTAALCLASGADAQTTRLSQSLDCLIVEDHHSANGLVKSIGVLDTRLHLYIFVPSTTKEFTLGVFDQNDDNPNAEASKFELYAPDGTPEHTLETPQKNNWSNYPISTNGKWGIWRLSVTGPQNLEAAKGQKVDKASNAFIVRTQGMVDLYLKPEPVARVRGLRLGAPHFGGSATHRLTLQTVGQDRLRFQILRTAPSDAPQLTVGGRGVTKSSTILQNDDRLPTGTTLEAAEYRLPKPLSEQTSFAISDVNSTYGLGIEQESRLFFNSAPLQNLKPVELQTKDEAGQGVAARLELTSPQTANETSIVYTGPNGKVSFYALSGAHYRLTATRGFEFEPVNLAFDSASKPVSATLKRRWPKLAGWYSGDDHCHSIYYDGTFTPRQMIEAARAAGLDYAAVSEHGHSESIERALQANAEALGLNEAGRFSVVPATEYTGPQFHANILGALVPVRSGATLGEVLDAARAADSVTAPVTAKLNHPTLGQTAAQLGRETPQLALLELWNSKEPEATQLWWELLNRGQHVFADTASDSHHRENLEMGSRRTYVYLGDEPLSAANVVRALREGRSFMSRGAVLDFRIDSALPGTSHPLSTRKSLSMRLEVHSSRPLNNIEIIRNGEVVHHIEGSGKTDSLTTFDLPAQTGWYLARVTERGARATEPPLAMTNPIWVEKN